MKKHFRATEYYTSYNATEPVELDSDWFPDFKGTTEEEFFNYIVEKFYCLFLAFNYGADGIKGILSPRCARLEQQLPRYSAVPDTFQETVQ